MRPIDRPRRGLLIGRIGLVGASADCLNHKTHYFIFWAVYNR
jgi:hypothetical protein